MKISQTGIELIKEFEGLRLNAYDDSTGVWTIGYGHTVGVKQGDKITNKQAEDYLKKDLVIYENAVKRTDLKVNQYQFDALVSFTYNCGEGSLKTLLKNRSLSEISEALLLYNKAGGKKLLGLERRREAERKLFNTKEVKKEVVKKNVKENHYLVKRGDNLSTIASNHGVTINALQNLNGIKNPHKIYIGQKLTLPNNTKVKTHKVKIGDTLSGISSTYGVNMWEVKAKNGIQDVNKIHVGDVIKL